MAGSVSLVLFCVLINLKANNNDDDDNNNNNNNNGNFICVFGCTILNLSTYRQFTNAVWDWIIQKKERKKKEKKRNHNSHM